MKSVISACDPREEVLRGELREEIFAARLRDVIEARADDVYQKPEVFFDNTYPTAGLKTLLAEALGRLSGARPANNSIIRLETAFGGGKTHSLIALYHIASGHVPATMAPQFVDATLVPKPGEVRRVGVVGTDLDAEGGILHGEIRARTLWGEIAWQLGEGEGYALVERSDRDFAAPGTGWLEELVGEKPTLILLDEIARHLRSGKATATVTGKSDLAEQTVAFLVSLFEFAASKERVVVVLTLADSSDAFGRETDDIRTELAEAQRIAARQERVITPTGEAEISAIVTHRLFRSIDQSAAKEAAKEYAATYRTLLDQGADLPQLAGRAEYAADIEADFPFHPELLNTLNRKVSTIPNFQKTRGALRLLAMVVRNTWDRKSSHTGLIGLDSIDLAEDDIADDLTSRLQRPAFKQVIEADITSPRSGSPAHAQQIDAQAHAASRPTFATRTATAVFLHSLAQGVASGVDPADVRLAVLRPDEDSTLIDKSLEQLVDMCWFLDWDGHRYRFKTEASLNKVVADEMQMVGTTKAKREIDRRIRDGLIWRKGIFRPVAFPAEPADVDDDAAEPKLVVAHYDAVATKSADTEIPDLVRRIFEHAGGQQGFRQYRNNLMFLIADGDHIDRMVELAQKQLALQRLLTDAERMSEFNDEQRKKLKGMLDESELALRIAITRAYRFLYYPSADAPQRDANLAREVLPAQDQGEIEKDQSQVVLRALRTLDKVLTADDKPLSAAYVKAKAWDSNQADVSTEDLRRAFARRLSLRFLLDPDQLKRTIRDGAQQGTWVYFDTQEQLGYAAVSPAPMVRISEDSILYTPDEAKARGLKIKGAPEPSDEGERCPVCGSRVDDCTCGEGVDVSRPRASLRAEGAPAQAFQSIVDQARDGKVARLAQLTIQLEGQDTEGAQETRAIGLAVPQLGSGTFRIEQQLGAQFGDSEALSTNYAGGWDRYKRVKQVTDAFVQEATRLTARTRLVITWPNGMDVEGTEVGAMRDVLTQLGLGRIAVEAQAEEQQGE